MIDALLSSAMWNEWMNGPVLARLGWVLAHFLWQGALIAGLHAGGVYLLRRHAPDVRYALSLVALVGLMACPVVTWMVLPAPEAVTVMEPVHGTAVSDGMAIRAGDAVIMHAPRPSHAPGQKGRPSVSAAPAPPSITPDRPVVAPVPERPAWYAGWLPSLSPAWADRMVRRLVALWLAGVGVLSLRLAGGWGYAQYIRRTATPAAPRWQSCTDRIAAQLGLPRGVRVLHTRRVEAPATVGWWRPVVLVPMGLFAGLPPAQVEAILMHELAHIRRHDYLVGLLQAVAETVLFYHPAVWYVSGHLRREREFCCDDVALTLGASRVAYARVLAAMAEHRRPMRSVALAAHGGSLLDRIRRIVHPAPARRHQPYVTVVAVLAVTLLVVVMGACASQAPARTPEPDTEQAAAEQAKQEEERVHAEVEKRTSKAAEERAEAEVARRAREHEYARHHVIYQHSDSDAHAIIADDDTARATVIVNDDTLYFAGKGQGSQRVFRITSDKPIRVLNADSLRREGLVPRGQRTFTRGDSTYVRLFTDAERARLGQRGRFYFVGPDSLMPEGSPVPDAPLPPGVSVVVPDLPDMDFVIPDVPLPPDSALTELLRSYRRAPGAPGGNVFFLSPDSTDAGAWVYEFDADNPYGTLYSDSLSARMEEWARRYAEEQEERTQRYREWVQEYGERNQEYSERNQEYSERMQEYSERMQEQQQRLLERRAERLRREADRLEERARQLEERRRAEENEQGSEEQGGDDQNGREENGGDQEDGGQNSSGPDNRNAPQSRALNEAEVSRMGPAGQPRLPAPRVASVSVRTVQ